MTTVSMGVQDELWLTMDRPNNLMVVDGCMVLRGIPEPEDVFAVFAAATEHFPVLHRRPVRDGQGWAWEDDPEFSLERHVAFYEYEEPADLRDLQAFVAEQRSEPMPEHHPLWRAYLLSPVELEDGTIGSAIATRFHHAIADGVRLTQLLLGLCEADSSEVAAVVARNGTKSDDDGDGEDLVQIARNAASSAAHVVEDGVSGLASGAVDAVTHPLSAITGLPGKTIDVARSGYHGVELSVNLVRHPDRLLDALEVLGVEQHRSLNDLSSVTKIALTNTEKTVWSGSPGTDKAMAWSEPVSLAAVKQRGRELNATVNDIMVAAVAGGLRRYLELRKEDVGEVTWMVPVNLKPFEDNLPPELGNYFALIFLPMPLDEESPDARVEQMHHRMDRIKNSDEAVLTFGMQQMVSMSPGQVAFFLTNFFANKAVGVLSNVPGPTGPIRFANIPVHQVVGFAPCSGDQPMTATIFSYNGGVTVGFATDAGLIPDPDELVRYTIEDLENMGISRLSED